MATITEALAEIKTIDARIAKKTAFIQEHLVRQEKFRDPLEKDGGQYPVIAREMQAIGDLYERKVQLRLAIDQANSVTEIGGKSIKYWLVWKREVVPGLNAFHNVLTRTIQAARQQAQKVGAPVTSGGQVADNPQNMQVNLGELDGQLSLKNATVPVEVAA